MLALLIGFLWRATRYLSLKGYHRAISGRFDQPKSANATSSIKFIGIFTSLNVVQEDCQL
jgi:hypothetical protein